MQENVLLKANPIFVGYRSPGDKYTVSVFARNITNAENIKGAIDFNNLTGFVNEPRVFGVALSGNWK